jgi:hypothetical protein
MENHHFILEISLFHDLFLPASPQVTSEEREAVLRSLTADLRPPIR